MPRWNKFANTQCCATLFHKRLKNLAGLFDRKTVLVVVAEIEAVDFHRLGVSYVVGVLESHIHAGVHVVHSHDLKVPVGNDRRHSEQTVIRR